SSFDSVAVYIRTGTETRPKEITPDQIARGTVLTFPHAGRWETRFGARTLGTLWKALEAIATSCSGLRRRRPSRGTWRVGGAGAPRPGCPRAPRDSRRALPGGDARPRRDPFARRRAARRRSRRSRPARGSGARPA